MLTYLIFMAPAILLALWAQFRVKSTFHRFAQVPTRSGLTGADVARLLLRARGLDEVRVEKTAGHLTDHYDPRDKTLRLSEATHDSRSVAAIGVAAHEAGHALQDADRYAPLEFRSKVVPMVALGSRLLPILILIAVFGGLVGQFGSFVVWGIVVALSAIVLFSLITLPVEFDASKRALATLGNTNILVGDELTGARSVLNAAALTYVAAAVSAIMELAYWAMHLFGGGSSDE
jgi:Zn-dependent membrane protease YugP